MCFYKVFLHFNCALHALPAYKTRHTAIARTPHKNIFHCLYAVATSAGARSFSIPSNANSNLEKVILQKKKKSLIGITTAALAGAEGQTLINTHHQCQ